MLLDGQLKEYMPGKKDRHPGASDIVRMGQSIQEKAHTLYCTGNIGSGDEWELLSTFNEFSLQDFRAFVGCSGPEPKAFLAISPINMGVNGYSVLAAG